jgi:hypothetical protein
MRRRSVFTLAFLGFAMILHGQNRKLIDLTYPFRYRDHLSSHLLPT